MAMFWGTRPEAHVEPPRVPQAARMVRKIALCGSHSDSLADAPWSDPSWEFWGHASSRAWYKRKMDRYFDLHPRACWTRGGKKGDAGTYIKWLQRNTVPIYMQDKYPEVPASEKYPKGRILLEYGDARRYFTNHAAWMIALALTEGVTHIGIFGINYGTESEYVRQRGSAEYWLGRASQAGVRLVIPEQCTLLAEPGLLYGYESHDEVTGELKAEYKRKAWKPQETITPVAEADGVIPRVAIPQKIAELIAAEEAAQPRPDWSLGPLPTKRTDGDASVSA